MTDNSDPMPIPFESCGSPREAHKELLSYLIPSKVQPVMPSGTTT